MTVWAWFRSAGSCVASGILLRFRRAPSHVLVNSLFSAFCVAWLVDRVLLGFSFVFRRGFFSKSVFLAVSLRFILYKCSLAISTCFFGELLDMFLRSHRIGVCCSVIDQLAWLIRAQHTTVCRRA